MNVKKMILLVALISLMALWGCSSSMDSAGVPATDPEPDVVGTAACQVCHSGAHSDASSGLRSAGSENLVAPLAADQTIYDVTHTCENCHGAGQFHVVDPVHLSVQTPAPDQDTCAVCHSDNVDAILAWVDHTFVDSSANDAPSCSNCHQPLTLTHDIGCTPCHEDIADKVIASMHNEGGTRTGSNCQRCHTTEGFVNLVNNGWIPTANANYTALDPAPAVFHPPTCFACHDSHSPNIRVIAGWDPNLNGDGDQFDLCTACHNLLDNTGTVMVGGSTFYHSGTWYRFIASTHYDNPATTAVIEGYNIRKEDENPCFDCHGKELRANTRRHTEAPDPDNPTYGPTIFTDWANSAHAGDLLAAKVVAAALPSSGADEVNDVMAAGVIDNAIGAAWVHYDWDHTYKAAGAKDRADCQRCHTATGAMNYMTDPDSYDPDNNDFSHLQDWQLHTSVADQATTPSGQNELLYCWGCHSNASAGEVRDPGPITAEYVFSDDTTEDFPDVTTSNLCISCHAGRDSGNDVKNVLDADIVNKSLINSHYLAAAGVLFKANGYEYESADGFRIYDNMSYFAHDVLGTAAEPGTGTSGPCVACHLGNGSETPDHTMVLGGFQGGTCGTPDGGVAGACHSTLTEVEIEEEAEAFENALYALSAILGSKGAGFVWSPAYPYIGQKDWTVGGTYSADQGRQMLGAAFNLNMLLREPGAFAHNRYYTKRLLIDSLDFAYDWDLEVLTPAVQIGRYDGSDAGAAIQAAVGMTYNDRHGDLQTFIQAQADMADAYLDAGTDAGFQRR